MNGQMNRQEVPAHYVRFVPVSSSSSPLPIPPVHPPPPPQPSATLVCDEILDRMSPDLWPESVPGLLEKNRDNGLQLGPSRPRKFPTEINQEDVRLVNDLGRLSADQLMEYVRNLQNNAFLLGIEEKKQFEKGKLLKIFEKRTDLQLV